MNLLSNRKKVILRINLRGISSISNLPKIKRIERKFNRARVRPLCPSNHTIGQVAPTTSDLKPKTKWKVVTITENTPMIIKKITI